MDVALGREPLHEFDALGPVQVDGDALDAEVQLVEGRAVVDVALAAQAHPPQEVRVDAGLDLQHLRTETGEHGGRLGNDRADTELQDAQARQRSLVGRGVRNTVHGDRRRCTHRLVEERPGVVVVFTECRGGAHLDVQFGRPQPMGRAHQVHGTEVRVLHGRHDLAFADVAVVLEVGKGVHRRGGQAPLLPADEDLLHGALPDQVVADELQPVQVLDPEGEVAPRAGYELVGLAEQLDERFPLLGGHGEDPDVAVLRLVDRESAGAKPSGDGALAVPVRVVGHQGPGPRRDAGRRRFLVGDLVAHRTCAPAMSQQACRRHDPGIDAGPVEREPGRGVAGGLVRPAARCEAAAGGEADDGRDAEPERVGDGHGHRRFRGGFECMERGSVGIEDDVGAGAESAQEGHVVGVLGIDDDALLVGVAGKEREAAAGGFAGAGHAGPTSPREGAVGRFDQQNLGAESGPDETGVLRQRVCEFDDPEAGQQSVRHRVNSPPSVIER